MDHEQHKLVELINGGYAANLDRIIDLKKDINELLHHEEVFWKQRSHFIWLLTEDKIKKFFHQRASHRHRMNHIKGLLDDHDTQQTEGN